MNVCIDDVYVWMCMGDGVWLVRRGEKKKGQGTRGKLILTG